MSAINSFATHITTNNELVNRRGLSKNVVCFTTFFTRHKTEVKMDFDVGITTFLCGNGIAFLKDACYYKDSC